MFMPRRCVQVRELTFIRHLQTHVTVSNAPPGTGSAQIRALLEDLAGDNSIALIEDQAQSFAQDPSQRMLWQPPQHKKGSSSTFSVVLADESFLPKVLKLGGTKLSQTIKISVNDLKESQEGNTAPSSLSGGGMDQNELDHRLLASLARASSMQVFFLQDVPTSVTIRVH